MKLLVYGSLEFGRVLRNVLVSCDHEFAGFIDDVHTGEEVIGTYASVASDYPPSSYGIVIGVGYRNLKARWDIYQKVVSDGYRVPHLIHGRSYVGAVDSVGRGAVIMMGAIVDVTACVRDLAVLWPGSVVNHDCEVGENTFLSPNSTVCGVVKIGRNCFVGAGAVIVDHRTVPDGSFIKAGEVYA
jgi:sugar O-acyltransferase (sialic acid O-acetyltransferase NeuD family)